MRPLLTRIALLLGLLASTQPTQARQNFVSLVPNGTSLGCIMCHGQQGPPLNSFGSAFKSRNQTWSAALAALDSDRDGFTNGQEVGDPNGTWRPGNPNPTGPITYPGDATSHSAPVDVAPSITKQPLSQRVQAGAKVTFSVVAAGTSPLGYQWSKDGKAISGATTDTFTIASASNADAGDYGVKVSNAIGFADSTLATLTVLTTPPPPVPTPLTVTVTSPANGAEFAAPASFNLTATVSPATGATQVRLLQSDKVLATLTAPPYSLAISGLKEGHYTYSAEATDTAGTTYSSTKVSITVTNLPTPPPVDTEAVVTVISADANASETNLDPGTFRILRRGGDTNASLVVYYSLRGTAVNGQDYQLLPDSVTIPAGSLSADVTVVPIADNDTPVAGKDTVVLSLDDSPKGATPYDVGSPHDAVVVISEPVTPGVNQPPVGRILRPTAGARFNAGSTVPLVAVAADPDGTVASTEFFVGDTSLGLARSTSRGGHDDESPVTFYILNWSKVAAGTYTLTAKFTDNAGAVTVSSPVTVTVSAKSKRGGGDRGGHDNRGGHDDEGGHD